MTDKKPLLSIIVPVYKVEQYLPACIDSIISQDFRDYELLLIDDGSPDRSGEICDEYAKKDHRINVIHQENAGLANVRNTGLSHALGDFICFVDSDDLIMEHSLSQMKDELLKSDADIVLASIERFDEKGNSRPYTRLTERCEMTGKEALSLLLNGRKLNITMCGGIYRKYIFNGIHFPDGLICEDWYVTPYMYLNAQKVVYIPMSWYRYRDNTQSIMGGLYKKANPQVIEVCHHVINVIRESGDQQLFFDTLWANLKRVWKYVGVIYSHHLAKEEKAFLSKVRTFLLLYRKDAVVFCKMSISERVGTWAFCYMPFLCNLLYFLKRIIK